MVREVRLFALALLVAPAVVALPAAAQEVRPGQPISMTIRGFINASFFLQDAAFLPGNGHRALFVQLELDDWFHGADARGTRIGIDLTGPAVAGDWRTGGTIELDFHGAFAAVSPFGESQSQPRLRLAFADLTNGRTTVRFGQVWSLTLGNVPVSASHTGFILGWGSGGVMGWRFPGIQLFHTLSSPGAATTTQLRFALLRNSWDKPNPEAPGPAEFGLPQIEARADFAGRTEAGGWSAYLVGHYDSKDFGPVSPPAMPPPGVDRRLASWAVQAGGRLTSGEATAQGNVYIGRAMGHHLAQFLQRGDIRGWGAWGQVGVNVDERVSVWGFLGTDRPSSEDVRVAGASFTGGWIATPMIRYSAGPYALGFEWLYSRNTIIPDVARSGNQVILSALYSF